MTGLTAGSGPDREAGPFSLSTCRSSCIPPRPFQSLFTMSQLIAVSYPDPFKAQEVRLTLIKASRRST